jgi:N-acetylglucosamine-6-phosphate deacetylase
MISALIDAEIFDGDRLLSRHALIIDGQIIRDLVSAVHLPDDVEQVISLKGHSIVPGYIDLQINGGAECCSTTHRPLIRSEQWVTPMPVLAPRRSYPPW